MKENFVALPLFLRHYQQHLNVQGVLSYQLLLADEHYLNV
jgi:hypothetical protein